MFGKYGAAGILALLLAAAGPGGSAFAADPEPLGSAFQINGAPLGDAEGAPDVAILAAGGFVAVWEGSDQDGKGIFARGFDGKGKPVGAAALVNTTTAGDQERPAVASRANGDFVIVWQGTDPTTGQTRIFARSFTAAGVPLSAEVGVDVARSRSPSSPAVAVAPGGDFLVVWQSLDGNPLGTGADVFGRLLEADGDPLTAELALNRIAAGDQTDPAVAVMGSSDSAGFYVAWQSADADAGDIYLQHLDLGGDLQLKAEALVNASTESGEQREPAVAVSAIESDQGSLNRVAVVWEGPHSADQRIWYRFFDPAGQPAAAETLVDLDGEGMDQRAAAVALPAAAPEGVAQMVVTYTQVVAQEEILGAPCVIVGARRPRSLFSLRLDDPEFPISAPGPVTGASRIAMDPGGGFVVVWQEQGPKGVGIDLYARRYAATLFGDGFEDGGASRWSQIVP